jgi:GDP-4-dehydro-6-deoxy-D-mannose reductase
MAASPPRRLLVTGASGFVGSHLVPLLRTAYPSAQVVTDRVDVTDRGAVFAVVQELQPDACIHLAAVATIAAAVQDADRAWHVNLHGTLNVANAVLAHAKDCHLLFASSAETYGASFASGTPLDETAMLAPMNTYAATKAAADLALGAMVRDGLKLVRLRLFNHTGPGQSEHFVVPAFARQIALIQAGRQAPPLRTGGLASMRDFLDVRDVCAAYTACLQRLAELAPGTILNIASGEARRIGDILRDLLNFAGLETDVSTDAVRMRGPEIERASGVSARAHQLLGWRPVIPWRQTLLDVLADWRLRIA